MAIDDLPLNRPKPSGTPPAASGPNGSSAKRWMIAAALIVIAGSGLALWWMSRSQPRTALPPPTQATDVAVSSTRPKRQPMTLPTLDASDALLRQLVAALSRHPLLARLLATDQIVRNAALAVEQIGLGRTPAVPLQVLRPESRLAIVGGSTGRVDARTYARWDAATTSLVSIDPAQAAQLYVNVKPLFDDAYRELGHPSGDFDDSIARAIDTLLATPAVDGDPELIRRPGYYEHTDPALRALLPVQKQFILMGNANRARLADWLRRFAGVLEIKL